MRFMKNSSRLLAVMARKRTRSNRGLRGSIAWNNTRRLNSSHCRSRLRKREASSRSIRPGSWNSVWVRLAATSVVRSGSDMDSETGLRNRETGDGGSSPPF